MGRAYAHAGCARSRLRKLRTTQGAEKPLFAYFVEKLSNTKIASKIWRLVLVESLITNIVRDVRFLREGVLQIW